MHSLISEPSAPTFTCVNEQGRAAHTAREGSSPLSHWWTLESRGLLGVGVNSSLPPGSQADNQKQVGRHETLINNGLNACSLQKASHQQISGCLTWLLVSEELPVIAL